MLSRHQPQNPGLIATKCSDPYVRVYDLNDSKEHSPTPTLAYIPASLTCRRLVCVATETNKMQQARTVSLAGHECGGWALCWSPHDKGVLVSGSDDGQILMVRAGCSSVWSSSCLL